jgi:hypothetical protein
MCASCPLLFRLMTEHRVSHVVPSDQESSALAWGTGNWKKVVIFSGNLMNILPQKDAN